VLELQAARVQLGRAELRRFLDALDIVRAAERLYLLGPQRGADIQIAGGIKSCALRGRPPTAYSVAPAC
jgi:hypothetical protein